MQTDKYKKKYKLVDFLDLAIGLLFDGLSRMDHEQDEFKVVAYRVGDKLIRIDIYPGVGFMGSQSDISEGKDNA